MHEFSIMENIIQIAVDTARNHQINLVRSIEIEVGAVSGVEIDSLRFAWESAKENTILSDAFLIIKETPLIVVCKKCGKQYQPEELYDSCPVCGEIMPEIISGKELRVLAIET